MHPAEGGTVAAEAPKIAGLESASSRIRQSEHLIGEALAPNQHPSGKVAMQVKRSSAPACLQKYP